MIVTVCYFLKFMKSVFILVQCNTSLSKNYVAHSITVVCAIGWIWEKNRFVCALRAVSRKTRIFTWIRIWQQSP